MKLFKRLLSTTNGFNIIKSDMTIDLNRVEKRYFVEFVKTEMWQNKITGSVSVKTVKTLDKLAFECQGDAKTYAENVERPSSSYYPDDDIKDSYATRIIYPKGFGKIYESLDKDKQKEFEEMFICSFSKQYCRVVYVSCDIVLKYFKDGWYKDHGNRLNDFDDVYSYFTLDQLPNLYKQKDLVQLFKAWTHKSNFENVVATYTQTDFGTYENRQISETEKNMKELVSKELERVEKYKELLEGLAAKN